MEPFTTSPERSHFAYDTPKQEDRIPRRMSSDPTLSSRRAPEMDLSQYEQRRHLTYPPPTDQFLSYQRTSSPSYFPLAFGLGQPEQYSAPAPQGHMLVPSQTGGFHMPFMTPTYSYYPTTADLKPFRCNECGQRFGRSHDLKRHHKIHLNLRPYCCFKCDRHFTRLDALRRHQTTKKCRQRESAPAEPPSLP